MPARETVVFRNFQRAQQTWVEFMTDQSGSRLPIHVRSAGHSYWELDVGVDKKNNEAFTVELVTEGEIFVRQDGREYSVGPDTAFLHRPGSSIDYSVGNAGFARKLYVEIAGPLVESYAAGLGMTDVDICKPVHPRRLEHLLSAAEALLTKPGMHDPIAAGNLAVRILLEMAFGGIAPPYPPALQPVLELMTHNINGHVTVKALADAAGMSAPHLYRLFVTHFHEPPLKYFMRMKMRRAAMLVKALPLSVKQLADRLGFRRSDHFCKVFRGFLGVSPGAYRRGEGG